MRIAVDAMGGDYAPTEIVAGALQGARLHGLALSLVGDPAAIKRELTGVETSDVDLEIVPAPDAIRMEEEPVQAVRERPGASINVACRLVMERGAAGALTMGHTGAGTVAALLNYGRIPGVERPAVIVPFLGLRPDLFLIDAGANTEVSPSRLYQFAIMGTAYAKGAAGIPSPRVGLISNGSEPGKGNKVGREAFTLLAAAKDLNFIGNIEGHTMLSSGVNVVVSDGFTGNVLFKGAEGIVDCLFTQVEEVLDRLPQEAKVTLESHLGLLRKRNNYASYGVAALLGVKFPMFIGHGRSKAEAVINGMATAKRMIAADVVGEIQRAMDQQDA